MYFEKNDLSLCVDIDGTVTGAYDWLPFTNEYFRRDFTEEDINIYDIDKLYGIPRADYDLFYRQYGSIIHRENKPRDYASKVLNHLRSLNHQIHFVTARETGMRSVTEDWLKKNEFQYDSLNMLGSHHKVQKAFDLNCDIFIEDRYENALELSKAGFPVLLIDTNYNRGILPGSVIRLRNWQEIEICLHRYLSFYCQQKIAN